MVEENMWCLDGKKMIRSSADGNKLERWLRVIDYKNGERLNGKMCKSNFT